MTERKVKGMQFETFSNILDEINFSLKREKNRKKLFYHLRYKHREIWQAIQKDTKNAKNILKIINIFFSDKFFTSLFLIEKIRKDRRKKFVEEIEMNKIERYMLNRFKNLYIKSKLTGEKMVLTSPILEIEICNRYYIKPSTYQRYYRPKLRSIKALAEKLANEEIKKIVEKEQAELQKIYENYKDL